MVDCNLCGVASARQDRGSICEECRPEHIACMTVNTIHDLLNLLPSLTPDVIENYRIELISMRIKINRLLDSVREQENNS